MDLDARFHEGLELAKSGKFEEALAIASELERSRFTGCFEIKAIVLNGSGDREGAIDTLIQGVAIKPVWRNGHLLGIYLSDVGRYDEALTAFDASLAMHGPEPKATALNKAITLDRMDRVEEAIDLLTSLVRDTGVDDEPEVTEIARDFLTKLEGRGEQTG